MTDTATDMINSPPHYIGEGGIEAIDVLEKYDLGLHLGTAVAYLLRAGRKGSKAEDLKKARWWFKRWADADLEEPTAFEHALEWADPGNVVFAFGLSGFHGDATEAILELAVFSNGEPPAVILNMLDEAIAEAEAAS